MITVEEPIYSPCAGTVERVYIKENTHVYEWEKLLLIKGNNGSVEEVAIGVSGHIKSLHVNVGEMVGPQTVLAVIKDDLLITGSD
ncbi:hypothetical protein HPT25_13085 [Bacillus sp. BRMEA1]|uniref:hypothetical protein n=1 Tax=Neobacillus endophyticus TaxID=2738405 RepID=UPI001565BF60|nr:hypothetical protein [Neobacillus endophyticus]NRD78300.1 hypothetical protein [Neobacillus endophyticus]